MTPEIYKATQATFISSTQLKAGDSFTISRLWKLNEFGFYYGVGDLTPEKIRGVKFKIKKINSDSIEIEVPFSSFYGNHKIPFFVIKDILNKEEYKLANHDVIFNKNGISCGCRQVSIRELQYMREKIALDKKYKDLEYYPELSFVNDPSNYIALYTLQDDPLYDTDGELLKISQELFNKAMDHLDEISSELKIPV